MRKSYQTQSPGSFHSSKVDMADIHPIKLTYLCDFKRHLICQPYSIPNLHRMAKELGIKKIWYHGKDHPHYDIPMRRYDEIRVKCTLIREREILKIIKEGLCLPSDTEKL